ncbi:hypothetical protein RA282_29490, partial [Pseudomonas syringae pv. tagetis]
TNKLLHATSVQLKMLSAVGRVVALAMAQELFSLGDGSTDKTPQRKLHCSISWMTTATHSRN